MTVSYHARCNGQPLPDYHCSREGIATGTPPCQTICGAGVDDAVSRVKKLRQLGALKVGDRSAVAGAARRVKLVLAVR
jgi:hypothetical protein